MAPEAINLRGEFNSMTLLADMVDAFSLGLKNDDGDIIACCNIGLKPRAIDERGEADAPRLGEAPAEDGRGRGRG